MEQQMRAQKRELNYQKLMSEAKTNKNSSPKNSMTGSSQDRKVESDAESVKDSKLNMYIKNKNN